MAMIKETAQWTDSIYLIDPNDPVEGGETGVDNRPHIELANRTTFLKEKTDGLDNRVKTLETKIETVKNLAEQGVNTTIIQNNVNELDDKITQEIGNRTAGDNHLQEQINSLKEQIAQLMANGNQQNGGSSTKTPVSAFDIVMSTHYSDNDNPKPWGMKVSATTTFGGFVPVVDGQKTLGGYRNLSISIPDWVKDNSQVLITITDKEVDNAQDYIILDIANHMINISQVRNRKGSRETVHPAGRVNVTFYQ